MVSKLGEPNIKGWKAPKKIRHAGSGLSQLPDVANDSQNNDHQRDTEVEKASLRLQRPKITSVMNNAALFVGGQSAATCCKLRFSKKETKLGRHCFVNPL